MKVVQKYIHLPLDAIRTSPVNMLFPSWMLAYIRALSMEYRRSLKFPAGMGNCNTESKDELKVGWEQLTHFHCWIHQWSLISEYLMCIEVSLYPKIYFEMWKSYIPVTCYTKNQKKWFNGSKEKCIKSHNNTPKTNGSERRV